MKPENYTRQIFFAMFFSLFILSAWNLYTSYKHKNVEKHKSENHNSAENLHDLQSSELVSLQDSIANSAQNRIQIQTDFLEGSINLNGLILDDLILNKYTENLNKTSSKVRILSPSNVENSSTVDFRFLTESEIDIPTATTIWNTSNKNPIKAGETREFWWKNSQGVMFKISLTINDNYLITTQSSVENNSAKPIKIAAFGRISRDINERNFKPNYISHEGFVGFLNATFNEIKYKTVRKADGFTVSYDTKEMVKPWFGNTDKYWLRAIKPLDANVSKVSIRLVKQTNSDVEKYQAFYATKFKELQPSESFTTKSIVFTGPKQLNLLDDYSKKYDIDFFDRSIDFGVLYFLTKPILIILKFIHKFIGNFGFAIILLTVLIKLILLPLATKGYISMGKMKALAPLMNAVREKYKDDKMNLNRELANIYKDKGINPFSGMLPMLIQIPFFFALYKVLFVGIDLRQEKFFGWICDLSAADPTSVFNLFGLIPFTPPSILQVGILPIIMGITMYLQQVLNPKSMSNNGQMKAIAYMPLIFTFILASFPSGLVIYWIVNNLFSVTHQFLVDKIYKNEISKVEASLVIKK